MMPKFAAEFALIIAAPGAEVIESEPAFAGEMRARAGAALKFVANDAKAWQAQFARVDCPSETLMDPALAQVEAAVVRAVDVLLGSPASANSVRLHVVYAGHGHGDYGDFVLSDGRFSARRLLEILETVVPIGADLRLTLALDSCHSAKFLLVCLEVAERLSTVALYDSYVACLPDEAAYELSYLEHGAFTFAMTHQGNAHVTFDELAEAVDRRDMPIVLRAVQGLGIPNPVALLTSAKQHAVHLHKNFRLNVQGAGYVSLPSGPLTLLGMCNALFLAKSAYGQEVPYEEH